jgi:hypothetical protein
MLVRAWPKAYGLGRWSNSKAIRVGALVSQGLTDLMHPIFEIRSSKKFAGKLKPRLEKKTGF